MVSSPPPSPPFPNATPEKTKQRGGGAATASEKVDRKYAHAATPLHHGGGTKKTPRGGKGGDAGAGDQAGYVAAVSCSDCRFTNKQQRALAPASPGAVIRSLFVSLTRRSTPRSSPSTTSAASDGAEGEQWRLAAADLSRRLAAATRTRDEALEETTRLRHSLAELELKLARLESRVLPIPAAASFPVDSFLRAVSTARAAVRNLARALPTHLRAASSLPPASSPPNLESFLNRAFHADFELDTDADAHTPDPAGRCEANLAAYRAVASLTWDEVLLHGTKHYSEGLSRFCDAKMSEVVASLGWARGARAWPEPLLQAFFLAAKGVWGVRLLARSVHPPLPVVRAERGARFDPRFMEDAAAGRAGRLEPTSVKMMVAPGFHVYLAGAGVVKCKVVCFYSGSRTSGHRDGGSTPANGGVVGLGSSCTDINGSAGTDVVEMCKTSRVGG